MIYEVFEEEFSTGRIYGLVLSGNLEKSAFRPKISLKNIGLRGEDTRQFLEKKNDLRFS